MKLNKKEMKLIYESLCETRNDFVLESYNLGVTKPIDVLNKYLHSDYKLEETISWWKDVAKPDFSFVINELHMKIKWFKNNITLFAKDISSQRRRELLMHKMAVAEIHAQTARKRLLKYINRTINTHKTLTTSFCSQNNSIKLITIRTRNCK
jgi:hypothetical protein